MVSGVLNEFVEHEGLLVGPVVVRKSVPLQVEPLKQATFRFDSGNELRNVIPVLHALH